MIESNWISSYEEPSDVPYKTVNDKNPEAALRSQNIHITENVSNHLSSFNPSEVLIAFFTCLFLLQGLRNILSPLRDSFIFSRCSSDIAPVLPHSPCLGLLHPPRLPGPTNPRPPSSKAGMLSRTVKEAILSRSHPEAAYCCLLTQQTIITLSHPPPRLWG